MGFSPSCGKDQEGSPNICTLPCPFPGQACPTRPWWQGEKNPPYLTAERTSQDQGPEPLTGDQTIRSDRDAKGNWTAMGSKDRHLWCRHCCRTSSLSPGTAAYWKQAGVAAPHCPPQDRVLRPRAAIQISGKDIKQPAPYAPAGPPPPQRSFPGHQARGGCAMPI